MWVDHSLFRLKSESTSMVAAGALTLRSGSGVIIMDNLSAPAAGKSLTIYADYDSAGDGTLTVLAGKTITTGSALVVTAWDIDLVGNLDSGSFATYVHGAKPAQTFGVGQASGNFEISDTELGHFTTSDRLSIGNDASSTLAVDGVTTGNSDSLGTLELRATGPDQQVQFTGSDSSFHKGISVHGMGGIVVTSSFYATGTASSLSAGTGTLTVQSSQMVSTGDQYLAVTADDLDIQGSISSGTATTLIECFTTNRLVGLGDTTAGQLHIASDEMQTLTAAGLIVGGSKCGLQTVVGVNAGHSAGISGTITLVAQQDDGQVLFLGTASTFEMLSVQADDGIHVRVSLTAKSGPLHLDADVEDSDAVDPTNSIGFTDGLTVKAAGLMTLEATTGSIMPEGAITLLAGEGLVLLNDFVPRSQFRNIVINADLPTTGDGTLTLAAGKLLSSNNGDLEVTAWDVDLQGNMVAGSAALTIHGAGAAQSIALGGTTKDMQITDTELSRVNAAAGVTIGSFRSGDMTVSGITGASSAALGALLLDATGDGKSITFDTAASEFNNGLTATAMAGLTVSQSLTTDSNGVATVLSAGTGTLQVLGTSVLSTTDQTLTLTGDDVVFASGASVSSGTAATLLSTYCSSAVSCDTAIGVGSAVEAFHMSDTELAVVVAQGGLTIGGTGGGSISVSGVSSAGTAQIGTLALVATKSGNTVTFKTSASSFNKGIMVQAASGIVVSESAFAEASGSFFDAGAGTLTVESSMTLNTDGQHLVITADDIDMKSASSVKSAVSGQYSGDITIHPFTAGREIGIGMTTKPLHLEDAELGRFSTSSSLTVGDSLSGSITVHGVTADKTSNVGRLTMIATKAGKTVEFSGSESVFNQGFSVEAAAGVVLSQDVTSNGVSSLSAGTGTLTLVSGKALSTSGQALTLIADDMDFQGTQISSGAATLTIASFGAKTIGVGTTSEDLDLEASELGIIQSGGLIVGSAGVNLGIKVVSITEANSNGIAGTVTFLASSDDSQVVFTGGASTFYGVSAQADDGVLVESGSAFAATGGSVYLDGDIENSGTSDTTNSVVFGNFTTVAAKKDLALESTTGNIQSTGALTLSAGTGIVIHDNLVGDSAGLLVVNADSEFGLGGSDGAFTIASGRSISLPGGSMLVTAYDMDIQGFIDVGSAAVTIHPSKPGQTLSVGGATVKDMHITDAELSHVTCASGFSVGNVITGDTVIFDITEASTEKTGSVTVRAEQAGAAVTFDTSPSTLSHGLNVYAMAGLTVSQDVTSKGANSTLSAGTGTLQVLGTSVLSTTDQTLTLTGDDVVFASGASVSSGTAATLLSTYCSSAVSCDTAIGVGSAVEAFHMSDTELAVVVAQGGLTIGGTGGGSISVSGVSSAGTAQIGTLALVATKSGNTVTFKTSASSFNKGIMVQAASGIVVSESAFAEASGSFFDAGAGTLTVESSMTLNTDGQHLVITADDIDMKSASSVKSAVSGQYSGDITIHPFTAGREIGIGMTTKPLHLEDAELGRFSTSSSLTVGDSLSGSITVHGVTADKTSNVGRLTMIATKAGKTVEFSGSESVFNQGFSVEAAAGVVLSQDVTSNGVSSLSAGTGTLTLVSGKALSTSGQALTLIADDMDFQGTQISSGAATLTIASFGAKTIGVGTTSEDLDLEASELGIIQSGGLIVGSAGVNLGIKVVSITEANSNGIAGTVTFLASSDDSQVVFTGGASTFYGVSAQADDGVLVESGSAFAATGGSVYLDGDIENSGTSDTTNSVVFSHNTTVTSKLTMTLESSTGNIQSQGSLTLAAGTGIFIHDNFDAGGTFPLVINADYEVQGDGAITVSAGKTLKTYNGELLMTAFDLDLQVPACGMMWQLHL